MDEDEINTMNEFLVGTDGETISVMRSKGVYTKEEALRLAAWLVVLADPLDERWPAIKEAVRNT